MEMKYAPEIIVIVLWLIIALLNSINFDIRSIIIILASAVIIIDQIKIMFLKRDK